MKAPLPRTPGALDALIAERHELIAALREHVALIRTIAAQHRATASRSRALLRRQAPVIDVRDLASPGAALAAALAAYDQAFEAPSVYGLPSDAAVAAYRAIVPSATEAAVRERLRDSLIARRSGRFS